MGAWDSKKKTAGSVCVCVCVKERERERVSIYATQVFWVQSVLPLTMVNTGDGL